MKTKELRKLNDEKLRKLLTQIKLEQVKAHTNWNAGESKMKEFERKSTAQIGAKTSLKRDLKRTIAKINTIMKEREREVK